MCRTIGIIICGVILTACSSSGGGGARPTPAPAPMQDIVNAESYDFRLNPSDNDSRVTGDLGVKATGDRRFWEGRRTLAQYRTGLGFAAEGGVITYIGTATTLQDFFNAHEQGWNGDGKYLYVDVSTSINANDVTESRIVAPGLEAVNAVTTPRDVAVCNALRTSANHGCHTIPVEGPFNTNFAAIATAIVGHKFAGLTNAQAYDIVNRTRDDDPNSGTFGGISLNNALSPLGNLRATPLHPVTAPAHGGSYVALEEGQYFSGLTPDEYDWVGTGDSRWFITDVGTGTPAEGAARWSNIATGSGNDRTVSNYVDGANANSNLSNGTAMSDSLFDDTYTALEDVFYAHLVGWNGDGKYIYIDTASVSAEHRDLVNFIAPGVEAVNADDINFNAVNVCNAVRGTGDGCSAIPDQIPTGGSAGVTDGLDVFAASVTALVGHKFSTLTNGQAWEIVDRTKDVIEGIDLAAALSPVGLLR